MFIKWEGKRDIHSPPPPILQDLMHNSTPDLIVSADTISM